jgi:hypothetical protein
LVWQAQVIANQRDAIRTLEHLRLGNGKMAGYKRRLKWPGVLDTKALAIEPGFYSPAAGRTLRPRHGDHHQAWCKQLLAAHS